MINKYVLTDDFHIHFHQIIRRLNPYNATIYIVNYKTRNICMVVFLLPLSL